MNIDTTIDELDLSLRLGNNLHKACEEMPEAAVKLGLPEPATVGAIIQWSRQDLLKIGHTGVKGIRELEKAITDGGFALRDPNRPFEQKYCRLCWRKVDPAHAFCLEHRCQARGCLRSRDAGAFCIDHVGPNLAPAPLFDKGARGTPFDELDAVAQIVRMLRDQPIEARARVLKATCALLEHQGD